jgi:high-affinity nickel-transport protein
VNLVAILTLGFLLGMRHATDADHVMAVTAIVSRERTLRAAAPVGVLWGLGHTLTILLVGGAIVLFGVVIPPRLGLGMELLVAIMLVVLGGLNVGAVLRRIGRAGDAASRAGDRETDGPAPSMRPLVVGIVHGLAGSAAVSLLVLGAIRDAAWAVGYLLVFGAGTVVGMVVITTAFAIPVAAAAARFARIHRSLGVVTGLASVGFGTALVYQIGFVHGLFTGHPQWTPQ